MSHRSPALFLLAAVRLNRPIIRQKDGAASFGRSHPITASILCQARGRELWEASSYTEQFAALPVHTSTATPVRYHIISSLLWPEGFWSEASSNNIAPASGQVIAPNSNTATATT